MKPFLKWVGGKTQLLKEIDSRLPNMYNITRYVEPFLGGGAVLFHILNNYKIKEIIVNDLNSTLILAYTEIKENVTSLIKELEKLQNSYNETPTHIEDEHWRRNFYMSKRVEFNTIENVPKNYTKIAALFIFLNKTCFNGLYRVNKAGLFNVPMGNYKKVTVFDKDNLLEISKKLQSVNFLNTNYENILDYINDTTFCYLDPPYHKLTDTSFVNYGKEGFSDDSQMSVFKFISEIDDIGAKFMMSNADPKNHNIYDNVFDSLYADYNIYRVKANRFINSNGKERTGISEIIVTNYKKGE